MSLECGRKPEHPEETYADTGTQKGPWSPQLIYFLSACKIVFLVCVFVLNSSTFHEFSLWYLYLAGKGVEDCSSCHPGHTLSEGACESLCVMGEYVVFEVLIESSLENSKIHSQNTEEVHKVKEATLLLF